MTTYKYILMAGIKISKWQTDKYLSQSNYLIEVNK